MESKNSNWSIVIIAIMGIILLIYFWTRDGDMVPISNNGNEVGAPTTTSNGSGGNEMGAGTTTQSVGTGSSVAIGQLFSSSGVSITPIQILEDSRCPQDVECIQAGTVRVMAQVSGINGNMTQTFTLNEPVSYGSNTITLTAVEPSAQAITSAGLVNYALYFDVR